MLLQGRGREGVEEAGGQRRPAEAAARPGQEQSQLHLARQPAGTRSPGREDCRQRTGGPRRSRANAPTSELSPGPSWKCLGGAHASQGRLFKFGEVGSAPSKGAWGFLINPRRSGAEEAAVEAEPGEGGGRGGVPAPLGVPGAARPESQTLCLGPRTQAL